MGMVKDLTSANSTIGVAVSGAYASIVQTPTMRKGANKSNGFSVEVYASKTARDSGEQCFQQLTKHYVLKDENDPTLGTNEITIQDLYTVMTGGTVQDVAGGTVDVTGDDLKLLYIWLLTLDEWDGWASDEA